MASLNDSRIRRSVRTYVNFQIFRFTAYSSYPMELKFGSMIYGGPHNRSGPDFSISFQEALWGPHLLQITNQFTAYSSYAIKLKLCRILYDDTLSRHHSVQLLDLRFSTFPQEAL